MKRRTVLALLGGAAASWPLGTMAQQPERVRRIAMLRNGDPDAASVKAIHAAIVDGLRRLGWVEGRNLSIAFGAVQADQGRFDAMARELFAIPPDVALASSSASVVAMRKVAGTTPIVFVGVTDPVAQHFVDNLARPGGTITGFSNSEFAISAKWLEILRELTPDATRILAVYNPSTNTKGWLPHVEGYGKPLHIEVEPVPIASAADLRKALLPYSGKPHVAAMLLIANAFDLDGVVTAMAEARLPTIYRTKAYVEAGGLITYSLDEPDLYRDVASYLDRILRGEKPGEMPVQNPSKFDLVINLKTAKALGLTLPPSLLARADEVIE